MHVLYFGFTPLLLGYGDTNAYAVAFVAVLSANIALIWLRTRVGGVRLNHHPVVVATRNAVMVAIVAKLFSPLLFAPALAILTVTSLLMGPLFSRLRSVVFLVAVMVAAVLVPWALEAAGVTATSIAVGDGDLWLHPLALAGRGGLALVLVLYVVVVIALAAPNPFTVRRAERETRRTLLLQAWHLRQLVTAR